MTKICIFFNLILLLFLMSCTKKVQIEIPVSIQSEVLINAALQDSTFAQVMASCQGNTLILLDIWASWCPDCIKGLDELKQIQTIYKNKNIIFLMLSVDDNSTKWRNAITKFNISGRHFLVKNGWKTSIFCNFLDIDWIPRYILINNKGKILHFDAINAGDKNLVLAIEKYLIK